VVNPQRKKLKSQGEQEACKEIRDVEKSDQGQCLGCIRLGDKETPPAEIGERFVFFPFSWGQLPGGGGNLGEKARLGSGTLWYNTGSVSGVHTQERTPKSTRGETLSGEGEMLLIQLTKLFWKRQKQIIYWGGNLNRREMTEKGG